MSNISTKRALFYWMFFGLFLMGGGAIMRSGWTIPPIAHEALDGLALLGAVLATLLATRAWMKTRAVLLGIVAAGFAGTTLLEALHVVAANPLLEPYMTASVENFTEWSWHATRVFFGLMLVLAVVHSKKDNFGSEPTVKTGRHPSLRIALVIAAIMAPACVFALLAADLRSIYYSSVGLLRLPELISGSLFLIALLASIRLGNWRTDSYGHWLNIGILSAVNGQIFCMAFSQTYLDGGYGFGHGLKVFGYFAMAFGFLMSHHMTARGVIDDTSKPRGLSLGAKVALLCGFIGFICVIPIAIKSSTNLHDVSEQNSYDALSAAAGDTSAAMERQRLRVDGDLDFLVGAAVALQLQDTNADTLGVNQDLVNMMKSLQRSNPEYVAISYVDPETRKALFRTVRTGWDSKVNARLFKTNEMMLTKRALEAGSTEDSANRSKLYDLQSEFRDSKTPVEAAAKIVSSPETGQPVGVIVVNSDVSAALVGKTIQGVDADLYVINTGGRFVVHPDKSKQFARGVTVESEFPGLDFSDTSVPGYAYQMVDGPELLMGFEKPDLGKGSGEALLYIYTGDRDLMEADATRIGNELQKIAQVNLLVAVLIGWFFARRFSKPVKEISAAAIEFGQSGEVAELPVDGRDEIGMLAKSLKEMMEEVQSQRGKLELLSSAVESSIDGTLITDKTSKIVYVNRQYLSYSGVNEEDLLGIWLKDLPEFKANEGMLAGSAGDEVDDRDNVWSGEMRVRRNDGRMHDEAVTVAPIKDEDGNIINHSVVIEDITERKEMERNIERKSAELQRSNRDLEQFAYVASHDLKAPLRAIEVLVGWLEDDLEDYEEAEGSDVKENLDLLRQRTGRLSRLLDDLLAYSRAGRKIGDIKTVNTEELVRDVGVLLNPPEGFTIEVAEDMPTITSYHAPLETVFRNLMGNAIKHSPVPAEGVIKVYCKDAGNRVQFSVQDNGTGIDPQYAEKVFKMFQTLQARDEKEGSGMGLAIVQRIIDWQDGKIWFEDGPDGKGTIFHFTWTKKPAVAPEIKTDEDEMSQTQVLRAQALAEGRVEEEDDPNDTQAQIA